MTREVLRTLVLAVGLALAALGVQGGEAVPPGGEAPPAPFAEQVWPWNSVDTPWRLFPRFEPLDLQVHGWLQAGYTYNRDKPSSGFNGVIGLNDRDDHLTLHQAYLIVERRVHPGELGFDVGGRVDFLWGYDSRFTQPAGSGLGASWNSHPFWGYDVPQAYLEVGAAVEGVTLDVKGGRFYSPIGYERIAAPANFFYSHSYSRIYGEPITHTGVVTTLSADLPMGTQISALGGFDRGWNRFHHNPAGNDTGYFAGGQFKAGWGTQGFDTSIGYIYAKSKETANPTIPGLKDDAQLHSVIFSQEILDRLTYVVQYDRGKQKSGSPFIGAPNGMPVNGGTATWWSAAHYVILEITRVWSVGFRHEKFHDADGSRVGGIGGRRSGSPIAAFGFKGDFYSNALGVNCKPTANLTFRAEVRRDSFKGTSGLGGLPYDDGKEKKQTTLSFDAILLF